jgi:Asp-tRNA(Asn)/Glu-tRNA(Gln) amidotransferase B subunit
MNPHITIGTQFEHNNQGTLREYKVLNIRKAPTDQYNDKVEIMNIRNHEVIEVEPEWFHQRKIKIVEHEGQQELF